MNWLLRCRMSDQSTTTTSENCASMSYSNIMFNDDTFNSWANPSLSSRRSYFTWFVMLNARCCLQSCRTTKKENPRPWRSDSADEEKADRTDEDAQNEGAVGQAGREVEPRDHGTIHFWITDVLCCDWSSSISLLFSPWNNKGCDWWIKSKTMPNSSGRWRQRWRKKFFSWNPRFVDK